MVFTAWKRFLKELSRVQEKSERVKFKSGARSYLDTAVAVTGEGAGAVVRVSVKGVCCLKGMGSKVEAPDSRGWTALHQAAASGAAPSSCVALASKLRFDTAAKLLLPPPQS
eukprot:3392451-Amphidinium_carterae.1